MRQPLLHRKIVADASQRLHTAPAMWEGPKTSCALGAPRAEGRGPVGRKATDSPKGRRVGNDSQPAAGWLHSNSWGTSPARGDIRPACTPVQRSGVLLNHPQPGDSPRGVHRTPIAPQETGGPWPRVHSPAPPSPQPYPFPSPPSPAIGSPAHTEASGGMNAPPGFPYVAHKPSGIKLCPRRPPAVPEPSLCRAAPPIVNLARSPPPARGSTAMAALYVCASRLLPLLQVGGPTMGFLSDSHFEKSENYLKKRIWPQVQIAKTPGKKANQVSQLRRKNL